MAFKMKTKKMRKMRKGGYKIGGAAATRSSRSRSRSSSRERGFKELVDSIIPLIPKDGKHQLLQELLTETRPIFRGTNIVEKIDGVDPRDRDSETTDKMRGWLIQTYTMCELLLNKRTRSFEGDPTINHVYSILKTIKKSFK